MLDFTYEQLPARIVFGTGACDRVGDELARLGLSRALILATAEQEAEASALGRRLGALAVGIFAKAKMHVPIEVAREARAEASRLNADCAVCIGGGSTIGLGKAIALEFGLPVIAIPTTYAGSEMTPIYGLTEGGVKKTGRDRRVLPRVVIYDPSLTLSLPPALSASSGMNAIAHCVEALYAPDANPIISLMSEDAIRALSNSLPAIIVNPRDSEAREHALYGAWLAGAALGAVAMSLHHKLCHTLGGSFNLPHAETHSIVLPHAVAYNASAAPGPMSRVAMALGAAEAATGLFDLAAGLGLPLGLRDIGMKRADLDEAARRALANPYANPRPLVLEAVRALLDDAFEGRRPQ